MATAQDAAHTALEGGRWNEALGLLTARAASGRLGLDELEWLGTAQYLTGRDEEAFESWTTGHNAALAVEDPERAARFGHLLLQALGFKGDLGRAQGWLERVRGLLADADLDCVEDGYLEHAAGMLRIFVDGDIPGANECFGRARKVAQRFRDAELRTLALLGEGRCLVYLGELAEGLARLDEAMVSVEAGDIGTIVTGDAYCTVIDGCHELFDLRRCEAWSASFVAWCDRHPDLVLYRGHCLLHRAEVAQVHGRWADAVAHAAEAFRRLAEPINPMAIGAAAYLEGDVHRLLGDDAAAEAAYGRANEHGREPQPGLSLLRLAQGRREDADATVRRVLAQEDNPIGRAQVLAAYVEIVLAGGDAAAAEEAVEELTGIATMLGSPVLRAQADHGRGAVLLAGGDANGALPPLRRAWKAWADLDAPYEGARTRLLLAVACDAVGDRDGADLERQGARALFERVGAQRELRAFDMLPAGPPDGLTAREVEVLVLVAKGHTNRAIAEALFISEKTVASHLTHVFTKLGLSSRSAATAYAYERGLV